MYRLGAIRNWQYSRILPKNAINTIYLGSRLSNVPAISTIRYQPPLSENNLCYIPKISIRLLSTRSRTKKTYNPFPNMTPYEILNVSRSADAKEIKLAYFREAKKHHPDLNPNDPAAKEKFQAVAAAYEVLSDEKRRRVYDATGSTGQQQASSGDGGAYNAQYQQQHAEDVFRSVSEDIDIVREAVSSYLEEMRDEISVTVDAARRGDWHTVWEVANAHKFLILGVVMPTFVFLRYPPAVFGVLRLLYVGAQLGVAGLVYTGNLEVAWRMIWRRIVKLSLEQKNRAAARRGTK